MAVRALSSPSVDRTVGGVWDILVDVRDTDGCLVDDAPVVTVTLPNNSTATPTVETVTTGVYRAEYLPAAAGRHVARAVTATHGTVAFVCFAAAVTANADMPDLDAVTEFLGAEAASWTAEEMNDALDAETAAQRRICNVPAAYPPDLRSALLRRVALYLRRKRELTEGRQPSADADFNPTATPAGDRDVRRWEGPFRKLVFG